MSKRIIAISLIAFVTASAAWAEKDKPNYGRRGWYVGAGGGAAFDFLDDVIADASDDLLAIDPTGSANARVGYRAASWFAFELMYEGAYGMAVNLGDGVFVPGFGIVSGEIASTTTHSIVGNLKFLVPIWRIHPYFMLGPGAQYGVFDGKGPLDGLDTERWDFMLRFGFGVDAYITENWLLNLELAPSVRFADYGDILSETTDNVTLTVGMGIQYRF